MHLLACAQAARVVLLLGALVGFWGGCAFCCGWVVLLLGAFWWGGVAVLWGVFGGCEQNRLRCLGVVLLFHLA